MRIRRVENWEESRPEDEEILRLRSLFSEARRIDPEAGDRIWRRLRPRLHRVEEAALNPPSLMTVLAAAGPRFAAGALFALVLAAGFFLTQHELPLAVPQSSIAPIQVAILENPEEIVGGSVIESRNGSELLQFIAYSPQDR